MPKTVEYSIFRGSECGNVIPDTVSRAIQPHEALVQITHAGLCGADKLSKNQSIVLGHHGTGIVQDVGSAVQHVRVGDRVGFDGTKVPCGNCDYCSADKEQYCEQRANFERVGSFATHAIWHERMLVKIPDGLEPKYVATLMCGGAIIWELLTTYSVRPGDRVGIHGVGGLGYLAIQMSSALGCDVVVFSSSASKRDEALKVGAKEFHVTPDLISQIPVAPVQHLFWCRDAAPDFPRIMPQVACGGTIYILSVGLDVVPVPMQTLVSNGIRIQGSCGASRKTIRSMLRFVQLHDIRPAIMTWPMTSDGIQAAFRTLEEGKMRYRGVLVGEAGRHTIHEH